MTTAIALPPGWDWGQFDQRYAALSALPRRVRVLLAAEWARSVLPIYEAVYPGDPRPLKAIEAAAAWVAAPSAARAAADAAAADAAADAAAADAAADAGQNKWRWLYATYRHAAGPEGLAFDPGWRTSTAVALARGIIADRAFDRFPILADALQDAGCDHAGLMSHLQADRGEWTAADWVLWNLLGYGD